MNIKKRIADLEARRKARTDRDGKPLYGYTKNVEAIDAALAELRQKDEDNGA